MKGMLLDLVSVLATPTAVFEKVKQAPHVAMPMLVLLIVLVTLDVAAFPFSQRCEYEIRSETAGEQAASDYVHSRQSYAVAGHTFSAMVVVLRWLLMAFALFLVVRILGADRVPIGAILAVVLYSEGILVLMGIVNLLLLLIRGVDAVHGWSDLRPLPGMDLFLRRPDEHLDLYLLLSNMNVFSVWYITTLSLGLSVVTGLRKSTSAIVVSATWMFGLLLLVAAVSISSHISAAGG